MTESEAKHRELTVLRVQAFTDLFGTKPVAVFPHHQLTGDPAEPFPIDVFVFPFGTAEGPAVAAVTNGMSDRRMTDPEDAGKWARRELVQYFRECTPAHARRLRHMAWLPLFDGFLLDSLHSVSWPWPAVEGTPWRNGFFLEPLVRSHREFAFEAETDPASLLWHVPISDEERAYKLEHGANALLDRMDAVKLPLIFDEANRRSLLE